MKKVNKYWCLNILCFICGAILASVVTAKICGRYKIQAGHEVALQIAKEIRRYDDFSLNTLKMCEFDRFQLRNIVKEGDSLVYETRWVRVGRVAVDYYYIEGDSVYWSNAYEETRKHVPAIQGADAATFMVARGTDYAKDKNHVYYPDGINYWDDYDDEWQEGRPSPVHVVKGADPNTFRCLGYSFAMDDSCMYFEGRPIFRNSLLLNPVNCLIFNSIYASIFAG